MVPDIKSKIFTIRGLQVMLDSDLAELYGVETGNLNKAAKRNIDRFPDNFMFQLTEVELASLRSQIVISNEDSEALRSQSATLDNDSLRFQNGTLNKEILRFQIGISSLNYGGRRYLPFVFTEQGVAMLSGVLKSETAVKISIQIVNAFVSMRRFIAENSGLFQRLDRVEIKQLEYDKKFEEVFDTLQGAQLPKTGIFFDGQIFDAYKFVSDIIRDAKKSIILIDNYIDDSVLTLFSKRRTEVNVIIYTKEISRQLSLDLNKYNSQYPKIELRNFGKSHDRFIIIDDVQVYHFGASLKDLGKKWFAFSRMDKELLKISDILGK